MLGAAGDVIAAHACVVRLTWRVWRVCWGCYSAGGRLILVGTYGNKLYILDARNGRVVARVQTRDAIKGAARIDPNTNIACVRRLPPTAPSPLFVGARGGAWRWDIA